MSNPVDAQTFHRRVHTVSAVQVTHANLHSVALWCGGQTWAASVVVDGQHYSRPYAASVGDWIVKVGPRFEVWTDADFRDQWVPVVPKTVYQPVREA